MVGFSGDGDSLRSFIGQDNPVAKRSSDFFESLLLGLAAWMRQMVLEVREMWHWEYVREEKVCDNKEKGGAHYEDVVVVLVDIGECAGSSLGDYYVELV